MQSITVTSARSSMNCKTSEPEKWSEVLDFNGYLKTFAKRQPEGPA